MAYVDYLRVNLTATKILKHTYPTTRNPRRGSIKDNGFGPDAQVRTSRNIEQEGKRSTMNDRQERLLIEYKRRLNVGTINH